MFGWDGCRFDWAFTPSVVGDPMRAKKSDWYDFKGTPSRKLYPDQDKAGTAALRAFRRAIAERHPEFIYGTNSGEYSPERLKALPKYKKEASTNSWIWFEYLLNYTSKRSRTWSKWTRRLVRDSQTARVNGSQVGLGWMRPYPPGSVTGALMPYAILYSGLHWIGPVDRDKSLGSNWRVWRYALRYSKYFYDPKMVRIPEKRRFKTISLANADNLFWREWVFERDFGKGRRLLVNMINASGDDFISERHLPPPSRRNIELTFKKRTNERVAKASLLLAEPMPHAVRLKVDDEGENAKIAIPEVKWGAAVLIETERGGGK